MNIQDEAELILTATCKGGCAMMTAEILGYVYDGGVYCCNCVEPEGDDWTPIEADHDSLDSSHDSMCCGICCHNLACRNQITGALWDACPQCAREEGGIYGS